MTSLVRDVVRRPTVIASMLALVGGAVLGLLAPHLESTSAAFVDESQAAAHITTRGACTGETYTQHVRALNPQLWWTFDAPQVGEPTVHGGAAWVDDSPIECASPGALSVPATPGSGAGCTTPVDVPGDAVWNLWVERPASAGVVASMSTDAGDLTVSSADGRYALNLDGHQLAVVDPPMPTPARPQMITVSRDGDQMSLTVDGSTTATAPEPTAPLGAACPGVGARLPDQVPATVVADEMFLVTHRLERKELRQIFEANTW